MASPAAPSSATRCRAEAVKTHRRYGGQSLGRCSRWRCTAPPIRQFRAGAACRRQDRRRRAPATAGLPASPASTLRCSGWGATTTSRTAVRCHRRLRAWRDLFAKLPTQPLSVVPGDGLETAGRGRRAHRIAMRGRATVSRRRRFVAIPRPLLRREGCSAAATHPRPPSSATAAPASPPIRGGPMLHSFKRVSLLEPAEPVSVSRCRWPGPPFPAGPPAGRRRAPTARFGRAPRRRPARNRSPTAAKALREPGVTALQDAAQRDEQAGDADARRLPRSGHQAQPGIARPAAGARRGGDTPERFRDGGGWPTSHGRSAPGSARCVRATGRPSWRCACRPAMPAVRHRAQVGGTVSQGGDPALRVNAPGSSDGRRVEHSEQRENQHDADDAPPN